MYALVALITIQVWGASLGAAEATEQVVLPLNTVNTFECQETADALLWYYNGISLDHLNHSDIEQESPESLGSGIIKQNLVVEATRAVNNSNITCLAVKNTRLVTVQEIDIVIQGYLKAPGGLIVQPLNHSAVTLRWEIPFTLNITNVEPDITHYTIHITNTDTGDVMQVNVTGTAEEYVFVGDNCRDYTYTLSITAWNAVGEGDTGVFPASGKSAPEVQSILVSFSEEGARADCNFVIQSPSYVEPSLPEMCTFYVSPSNGPTESFEVMVHGKPHHEVHLHDRIHLPMNDRYDLRITCDHSHATDHFGTYGTQSATATLGTDAAAGTVDVECTFAEGSTVQGCVVVFTDDCELKLNRSGHEVGMRVSRQIVLPQGMYHPKVYDIDQNGERSSQAAVSMNELTVPSSSISNCEEGNYTNQKEDSDIIVVTAPIVIACGCVVIITTIAIIVCMLIRYRKKVTGSRSAASKIPDVEQNTYCAPPHPLLTVSPSTGSDSSDLSQRTEESQVSLEQLEPPSGTPGLTYEALQLRQMGKSSVKQDSDVTYSTIVCDPNTA